MYRQTLTSINNTMKTSNSQIVLILGLRQTGKTTLAKTVCEAHDYQLFNFDLTSDRDDFISQNRHSLDNFARLYKDKIIFIDEVQKLSNATSIIKHLYDQYQMKFVLTGSSELKINKNFGDSLAGRLKIFRLYPLSIKEILVQKNALQENQNPTIDQSLSAMQKYLVFGSLPTIENIKSENYHSFLTDYIETLLAKDVLEIMEARKSTKIYAVTRLLAMQIGQLVNVNEIANLTELTRASVYSYLDILEQMNIICRSYPLSTNERQAISEKFRVYFTDLGLRNALINNFESLTTRLDIGAILENAVFIGLKRQLDYANKIYKIGFFRSSTGSEIDIVVKSNNEEKLYEVKTSKRYMKKKTKVEYITMQNAGEFLV